MPVSAQETVFHHVGNGITVTFAYSCQVLLAADLKLYVDDVLITSGFTVSGIGALTGGSITFDIAPISLAKVRIERVITLERTTDYQQNGDFLSRVVNPDFNRLWMALQQQGTDIGRSILVSKSEAATGLGPYVLPPISERANNLLSFDENGIPVVAAPVAQSATALQILYATFNGSSLMGFIQAGVGSIARTLQAKLRATLLDRNDFGTVGQFNTAAAAAPTTPTLDGSGNYGAKITPGGEAAQLALKDALLSVASGTRDPITYRSLYSVTINRKFAVMGGFRYRGQYTRGRAPVFPMPASTEASLLLHLGAMSSARVENWYAIFACANAGDAAAQIQLMPYLRVGSVAGNVVTLNKAGEGIHTVIAAAYSWTSTNNLAGCECLIISEGGGWSGRVATITANDSGSVTLSSAGSLAFGDFILPSPVSKAHYVYLASFYFDTAEVRNIYDSGSVVKSKMIYLMSPNISTGSFPTPGQNMTCGGYICPLATAIILDPSGVLSTASTGTIAEYYDPDGGSHVVHTGYFDKASTTSSTYVFGNVQVPFLYHQTFNYRNAGSLVASRISGQLNVTGWIEP